MSKLQELINKLCPNGVEFKPLGEVCEIKTGKGITKNDATGGGNYPIISGGQTPMGYYHEYNRGPKTVTISRVGAYAGFVSFIEEPFYLNDKCFSIIPINDFQTIINSRFLFHHLKNKEETIKNLQSEGGVPTINTKKVGSIMIPVPPIEVQEEIVRILDSFSDYAAELQAELQARKQQYEYYRNLLLTFNPSAYGCGTDDEQKDGVTTWEGHNYKIEWKKLGEIGNICMCKRILKHQTNTKSGIPFYKIGTFGKVADSYISEDLFMEYKKKYSFPQKGEILISASGTIGRAVIYDGEDAYFQDSNIVWINNDESMVLNKYLYYFYQIVDWNVEGGTIKRLYNTNLSNTPIPLPPLELQEKIVAILDRFETLVNDLTNGLPAEIAAVKDQYEYYRNKLLTFKKLSA
ncbi:MAG: restriction endonuclease subunit S [Sodaliphilus sp.]|nr:restriction endonuclease subunit S [Sodaliphilus sp.]